MKIAVIDLGTNTFNLLISENNPGRALPIVLEKNPVKLGLGFSNNRINQETLNRAFDCLQEYKNLIILNNVKKCIAFGTSALRSAENGPIFVKYIQDQLGIEINIIDGDMEAELIYQGVKKSGILTEQNSVIMDIGGGSTEYIIGNESKVLWKKSYPLGVSRLKNKFHPSDPLTNNELALITEHVLAYQADLFDQLKFHKVSNLIGSSGSFDSFGDLLFHHYQGEDIEEKAFIPLNKNSLHLLTQNILKLNLQERLDLKGLIPLRAELIPLSCILLNSVIDLEIIQSVQLCTHALKEGAINVIDNNKFAVSLH